MSFDPQSLLRKSTSRAKSDVANKLVGMLLHELSRKLNQGSGMSVNSAEYARFAAEFFGRHCPYCEDLLIERHVAVEHLDGMNRFRAGLHIPGNVVVSCSDCNREKRRDDQLPNLILAESGWQSFLSHDSSRCPNGCKTCVYWRDRYGSAEEAAEKLSEANRRIRDFREIPAIASALQASLRVRNQALLALETLYRGGQDYALRQIADLSEQILPLKF